MNDGRERASLLLTPPWRRAPLLLLRQPFVFLAIVGAAAVLAMAAASGPLFLSTVGTAGFAAQAASTCPESAQPTMVKTVAGPRVAPTAAAGLRALSANGLPRAYVMTNGYTQVGTALVHLYSGPDALDHVQTLTPRTGATGVWVPNTFAAKTGLKPGSTLKTQGGTTRVAGVYRDLAPNPFALSDLPRYWCTFTNQIVATVASDAAIAATPPESRYGAWLISDPGTVARISSSPVKVLWSSSLTAPHYPLSRFDRARPQVAAAAEAIGARVPADLGHVVAAAHAGRSGISGSIVPIEVAGVVVAALLVSGAGLFWAASRRREVRLLVARGVGPIALAGKAILETTIPAVVGAAIGYVATSYLVRAVGPANTLEPDAPWQALWLVAATLVVGLVLIGVIGGLSGRERTTGRRRSWLGYVPWELAVLGVALGLGTARHGQSAVTVDHTVVKISALVVLYPLLGATAALVLLGRIVGLLLPAAGRSARHLGTTLYLSLRRVSRSRIIAVGIIVGTALPCCLLMYGSTVTRTVSDEVTTKYQTNLGAPHVLQFYGAHNTLVATKGTGTHVVLYQQDAQFDSDHPTFVMGVDPATFDQFAFTTGSQRADVAKLAPPSRGAVPAILVSADRVPDPQHMTIGRTHLTLTPVASVGVFPGWRNSAYPLVVVNQRRLSHIDPEVERLNQMWTDDAHYGAARALLARHNYSVLFELTSDVVVGNSGLLPITWLFGYLRALAILIGLVAVAGLVFGLAARTRRRRVSYVLSRRMGMSKSVHLASLLVEIGTVVGLGWVAGSAFGVGAFRGVYRAFDVYPDLRPPPTFTTPVYPLVVTAVVVVVVVSAAAVATQVLAERTKPAEILRIE